jgi:putative selenium metabolism hydrolase
MNCLQEIINLLEWENNVNLKERVKEKADFYKEDLFKFLRDMIKIPSTSTNEEKVILRIKEEMEKLNYDEIVIDELGNILGRIGNGKRVIAMDGHIDTVDVGNLENWSYDPFEGMENDEIILGRGSSDQEGGFAAIVYAGKIIKDLDLAKDYTIWITGTVQEEDCDGMCWKYILDEKVITPEFVVITEPTSLNVYRGHRGRMEIKLTTTGISAHGSAPERGENAIYKMAPILIELEKLNENLKYDSFLGKGTLAVSEIFFTSPSRCAVADECNISIDRRLTQGENEESALKEIRDLESVKKSNAKVELYRYNRESYTGYKPDVDSYFPTWTIDENHSLCKAVVKSYEYLFNGKTKLDKWTFSTNGVSIMGRYGIPCIGFGPGHEDEAHAPNEKTFKEELYKAMQVYALIPDFVKGEEKSQ